jgi:branched-chain amino acid transport system substrate-binding protein
MKLNNIGARRPGAWLGGVVAALCLTVSLAACASSESSGGSSSGSVIPIGVIGTYSGALSADTVVGKEVIQAWADNVNASGGLEGHQVKLYIEDDQGNPALSDELLKQLVEQDHVVAIVGSAAQGTDSGWGAYLDSTGVPNVGGNGAGTGSLTSKSFFDTSGNIISLFYGTAEAARTYGPKLAQLYCAGSAPCESTVGLLKAMGQPLGVSLPYSSAVDGSSPDYTAICNGVKSSGVQSFSTSIPSDVLKRVAAQCTQQGVNATMISQVSNQTMAGQPGFENVQFVDAHFPFFADSTPATKEFHDALAKYAPDLGTSEHPLNFIAPAVWVSGKLFEAAVKAAGTSNVTAASVKKGLYALKNETLGGLSGPLNFSPDKKILSNCYFMYVLKNGKFETPGGVQAKCAPSSVIDPIVAEMTAK